MTGDPAASLITIQRVQDAADGGWLALRCALWTEDDVAEHLSDMADFVAQPERYAQFIARSDAGQPLGLAEAAIRTDYVNGCDSSPVAYLEGLYVRPEQRCRGIARALVAAVAAWGRERGCTELASDCLLDNTVSQAVHTRLGFLEMERVVCYRQVIAPEAASASP